MKNGINAGLSALGGAALALAFVWVRQETETPPVVPQPDHPAVNERPGTDHGASSASPVVDLAPVVQRLEELAQRMRSVEAKIDAVVAGPERTEAVDRTAVVDAHSLLHAMEGVEQLKLEALSDEALEREVWQFEEKRDPAGARRRLETLLQRSPTPEERAKWMTNLGRVLRNEGGEENLRASEKTLQTVIDTHGTSTPTGIAAAMGMVWTLSSRKEHARALSQALSVVNNASATEWQRLESRYAAAIMKQGLGDRDGARSDCQAILRDYAERPQFKALVAGAQHLLESL